MKTKSLLLIITLLLCTTLHAEPAYTDEEKRVMQRYYELFSQPDEEKEFYVLNQQVKAIMEKRSGRQGYYVFRINEVTYEINMGRSSKALKMAQEVLKEMKEHGDNYFDMIYSTMGTIYEDRGNYKMSHYYNEKAINMVQPTDTIGKIGAYLGMANLESSNHPDEAIRLVDYILPYCRKYPNHYNYAQTMKALAYFFKNDTEAFFRTLREYNMYKGEHNLMDEQNDGIMQTINAILTNNHQAAISLINDKTLFTENMGYYDMLIQMYKLKGEPEQVINVQRRKLNAIDSLNANLIFENMNQMNAEMEVNKAQQEVIRNRMYWLSAVLALLVVVMLLLLWRHLTRRRYQKRLLKKNQELEVALDHAKESDRMKTLFIQHVSHEIRTPLNVITGYAQIVNNPDYDLDDATRKSMLGDISRNTKAITDIVNELLELADGESREHYELNDDIAVNELCRKMINETESLNDGRLQLNFKSMVGDDYTLKSNRVALGNILLQLLNNAVKFTKEGSVELCVRELPANGGTEFSVTDTGIGISKEHQDLVFERFYKVDAFKQGFGLGLTVCLKMARLLGATLVLDKHYNKGARFVLTVHG